MKLIVLIGFLLAFFGCSSAPKKEEAPPSPPPRIFTKDYQVMESSHEQVPEWINNPTEWAKVNDAAEFKDYRYFVYDTEPKVSRGIACQLANAKAASAVAGEVTQFVKDAFGQSVQGDPTANDSALEEYVENTLVQEIQSFVVGAQVFKTYWEKRSFKVELGAPENKTAYTCAVLIKMTKKNIAKALERAQNMLEKNAKKETKENVRAALKDAAEKFNNLETDQTEQKKEE